MPEKACAKQSATHLAHGQQHGFVRGDQQVSLGFQCLVFLHQTGVANLQVSAGLFVGFLHQGMQVFLPFQVLIEQPLSVGLPGNVARMFKR